MYLFLILTLVFNSLCVDYYSLTSARYSNHYELDVYFTN